MSALSRGLGKKHGAGEEMCGDGVCPDTELAVTLYVLTNGIDATSARCALHLFF